MADTYTQMWHHLRMYSGAVPITLAQRWVTFRFREVWNKRLWSWRVAENQILTQLPYVTGTVSVTNKSPIVIGSGTAWTTAQLNRQFRIGMTAPIYTVIAVDTVNQIITLDQQFGGSTGSGFNYQIFDGYVVPPPDFQSWLVVRDVAFNRQLWTNISQDWLNMVDSYRAFSGNAYAVADYRYTTSNTSGTVGIAQQVTGSQGDPGPVSSGVYTGTTNSYFVVTITAGGAVGTAQFSWQKDQGTVNSNLVTQSQAFLLQEGVNVQFPAGTYVQGDVFVFNVVPGITYGLPMYELWPYQMSQRVYPFLYTKVPADLSDQNPNLPPYIHGDIIIKGALADLCRWRGTEEQPNPQFNPTLADNYEREFQFKTAEMEVVDNEVFQMDLRYADWISLPFALSPLGSADYLQSHAI